MTPATEDVIQIVKAVKKKNSRVFILWGGAHPMLYPRKALEEVDAISISEGEISFQEFYHAFSSEKEYASIPGISVSKKRRNCKKSSCSIIHQCPA